MGMMRPENPKVKPFVNTGLEYQTVARRVAAGR